jgi:lysophospholipase L1-like esterase
MKKALIISVLLNLIIISGFVGKKIYNRLAHTGTNAYADSVNTTKNDILQRLPIQEGDIVFVGNSITERFPMNEMFNSTRVKNRGIGSNSTAHVLSRTAPIAKAKPSKIFIEVGINDLAFNVPLQTIMINFRSIIDTIRAYSPGTGIYITTLLPTIGPDGHLMPEIIELNKELVSFCNAMYVTLVDTYTPFVDDKHMDTTLTTDGTHLNYDGYVKYAKALSGYVFK